MFYHVPTYAQFLMSCYIQWVFHEATVHPKKYDHPVPKLNATPIEVEVVLLHTDERTSLGEQRGFAISVMRRSPSAFIKNVIIIVTTTTLATAQLHIMIIFTPFSLFLLFSLLSGLSSPSAAAVFCARPFSAPAASQTARGFFPRCGPSSAYRSQVTKSP